VPPWWPQRQLHHVRVGDERRPPQQQQVLELQRRQYFERLGRHRGQQEAQLLHGVGGGVLRQQDRGSRGGVRLRLRRQRVPGQVLLPAAAEQPGQAGQHLGQRVSEAQRHPVQVMSSAKASDNINFFVTQPQPRALLQRRHLPLRPSLRPRGLQDGVRLLDVLQVQRPVGGVSRPAAQARQDALQQRDSAVHQGRVQRLHLSRVEPAGLLHHHAGPPQHRQEEAVRAGVSERDGHLPEHQRVRREGGTPTRGDQLETGIAVRQLSGEVHKAPPSLLDNEVIPSRKLNCIRKVARD
jgi:hypothetical protein